MPQPIKLLAALSTAGMRSLLVAICAICPLAKGYTPRGILWFRVTLTYSQVARDHHHALCTKHTCLAGWLCCDPSICYQSRYVCMTDQDMERLDFQSSIIEWVVCRLFKWCPLLRTPAGKRLRYLHLLCLSASITAAQACTLRHLVFHGERPAS
jgi:hypothetical protein